jgi:ketol-acid reductoisomerase
MPPNSPSRSPRRFDEKDGDLRLLGGCTVAVLGFGNQGHAHALNLRDAGVRVVVGARLEGTSAEAARAAGLVVRTLEEATSGSDLVMLLLPDEAHARVYTQIAPHLRPDAVVGFAHGFSVAFGLVDLPSTRRVMLVAPKGQGHRLRAAYQEGRGVPGLVAVQGPRPDATLQLALAYARAVGALAGGGFPTTFREEAVTDQFGEQAVLCGGLVELITAAWETLTARGYSPAVAYFECLYEVKLIADLLFAHGIDGMRERISSTAAYGGLKAGPRVIGPESRQALQRLLDEIEGGAFAQAFLAEQTAGAPWLREAIAAERTHPLQEAARVVRAQQAGREG